MHIAFVNETIKEYKERYSKLNEELKNKIVDESVLKIAIDEVLIKKDTDPKIYVYEVMLYEYRVYSNKNCGLEIADFFVQISANVLRNIESIFNKKISTLKELERLLNELENLLNRPLLNITDFSENEKSLIQLNYQN